LCDGVAALISDTKQRSDTLITTDRHIEMKGFKLNVTKAKIMGAHGLLIEVRVDSEKIQIVNIWMSDRRGRRGSSRGWKYQVQI